MGIILQLSAETLMTLFAMMQRAQGPQRQFVLVYNVPDADREKVAGNRRMWSDPVRVKHWEECLDTDTHIFFRESKFGDWSAYGAIQSVGRRETLNEPAIPNLRQPTIFVTKDTFFALGMGCPLPDIAVKYPVSRHPLPDPPSRNPEEYEATGYRFMEDILPGNLVDQLCAVHWEGDENWQDILLEGHNQGGRRRQTAGRVDKWLPLEIKWRLLRILSHLFPVLDDLEDGNPDWWNGWTPCPPRGAIPMATPRFHAYVVGCRGHEGCFRILANCTGEEPWLPHVQHVACGPAKAWQCFADGRNVDPSWSWRAGEDDFFPLCAGKIPHTPKMWWNRTMSRT